MSFVSPEYVLFFSVAIPLYFLIRPRMRWLLVVVLSYLFYAYGMAYYLPLIVVSTLVDYVAARMMPVRESGRWRTGWLAVSIIVNLGILFTFKYLDFFNAALGSMLGYTPQPFDLILPIGISFYTFQSMSYTIDVYRGRIQPEMHLGRVAMYVAFFPQLVAGPIERATNLLPQFRRVQRFDEARTIEGLQLILWGFFKKVVIADRLAIYVDAVYGDVGSYSGLSLWLATFFFAFQIYCDFSAYSNIAIGTARVMGINLMDNFRQPYFARSVREFWGRWHISLSTWFRDYVYIPLGGNRVPIGRNVVNIMIVFLLSGLWHGAGWNFIFWGALHGLAVAVLAFIQWRNWRLLPANGWGMDALRVLLTFGFVCFTWIFFRASSIDDAFYIIGNLFVFDSTVDLTAPFAAALLDPQIEFTLAFSLITILLAADALIARQSLPVVLQATPTALRWPLYYLLGAAVIFSGLYGAGAQQFIYFQF
jgi:alginate O-acetyltransferase complex protein AlgI